MSLDSLKASLEVLDSKIATAAAASGPTISVDGKNVDRVGWLNALLEQRQKLNEHIIAIDPYEERLTAWN